MIDIKRQAVAYQGLMTTQGESQWSLKYFITFLILGGGTAVLVSYLLSQLVAGLSGLLIFKLVCAFSLFLFLLVFQALMVKDLQFNIWLELVEAVGLMSFFYDRLSVWPLFGLFFFVLFSAIGFWFGQDDLNNHLKISFRRFAKAVFGYTAIGLTIFISFFCAGLYQQSGSVSPNVFKAGLTGSETVVRKFVPDFKLEMSFEEFLKSVVNESLHSRPELAALSEDSRNQLLSELANTLKLKVAAFTKVDSIQKESVVSYALRAFNNLLATLRNNGYGQLLVGGIVLIFFLFFRGIFYLLKWPVVYSSYFIYGVLLSMGIIYVLVEPRNKEVVLVK